MNLLFLCWLIAVCPSLRANRLGFGMTAATSYMKVLHNVGLNWNICVKASMVQVPAQHPQVTSLSHASGTLDHAYPKGVKGLPEVYGLLEIPEKPGKDGGLNIPNQVTNDLKLLIKVCGKSYATLKFE